LTKLTTRRAMREAERRGQLPAIPSPKSPEPAVLPVEVPVSPSGQQLTRRQMREMGLMQNPVATEEPPAVEALAAPEIELPEATFTGQNLFSEPSTESIVLDRAPEAIALPIETGEIAITGSIQVISDPVTGPTTATLDGMQLDDDQSDSVTGVISVVEPISALQLIDQRSGLGVVPNSVLRRGWWKPWLVAAVAIAMGGAAIFAVITILSLIGG
jgi:hypothetical protein